MKMFVGNATHHIINFIYRVPGQPKARTLVIPIGAQVRLPDELDGPAVDSIIAHHSKYGMVSANEIASVKQFSGTCFSLEKPIPAMKIEELMFFNRDELVQLGKEIREEACVVGHNIAEEAMDNVVTEHGVPPVPLRKMQVEILEERPDSRNENPVAEGYRVGREYQQQQPQQPKRRRRGA